MKIAIATEGSVVCPHFGHTPHFTFVNVENGKETGREVHPNPGHTPGALPRWMGEMNVNLVIAGGVGAQAQYLFRARGIDFITGATGDVNEVLKSFMEGNLKSGDNTCSHDHSDHTCGSCGE